ncbi:MAG: hypothetical protein II777_02840 [Clostridia bacterium]|nr:hypothetical protein [Clostridia bacterium]
MIPTYSTFGGNQPEKSESSGKRKRRIIHSEVQKIEGVTTGSVGTDTNRKVVVYPAKQPKEQ